MEPILCLIYDGLTHKSLNYGTLLLRSSDVTSWTAANQDCNGTSARSRGVPIHVATGCSCSVVQTWSNWFFGNLPALSCCATNLRLERPRGASAETARRRRRTRSNSDCTVTMCMCMKNTARNSVESTYKSTAVYAWKYMHILTHCICRCIYTVDLEYVSYTASQYMNHT